MADDKPITLEEFSRRGGLARARKYSKKQLRAWAKKAKKFGKLGGRPRKHGARRSAKSRKRNRRPRAGRKGNR